jgi:Flp pilus assembly protein TadG
MLKVAYPIRSVSTYRGRISVILGLSMMQSVFALLRDEMGAVTIEFVLWVPIFASLLVFVTDASIIYMTHSEMWNVARDTSRRMSTEKITTVNEVRDYAAAPLFLSEREYVIDPSFGSDMNVAIDGPKG